MAEFNCIGDEFALGVYIDKLEAEVGVHGWTNAEAILGTKIPRASGCWFGMDEDPTTNWPEWRFVEIKRPLKELPCTDPRVERGLLKEIEGEFGLWEKEIPKIGWKCSINAGQDCQEVVLEGANGPLCPIAAMHVRGNKLEGGLPLEIDSFFVGHAGFVIQDLEINGETSGCQMGHDGDVGGNLMVIALGLEGLLEDEVSISVKGDHHILVTETSPDRKVASVISKELAQWLCHDKDLVGRYSNGRLWTHKRQWSWLLGFC
jgi:hypothetical protein